MPAQSSLTKSCFGYEALPKSFWLTCANLSTVDDTRRPAVGWEKRGIVEWLKQAASSTAATNSRE